MRDLVVLVADSTMEAMVSEALKRNDALGIRPVDHEIIRHPKRDPGCYSDSVSYLRGYQKRFLHAVVLLDCAFSGAPLGGRVAIEKSMNELFHRAEMSEWAYPIAIDPELENWVWVDSPHLAAAIGWDTQKLQSPRLWLEEKGLWASGSPKPAFPKEALEATCRECCIPFSAAIHKRVARTVTLRKCDDPAFQALISKLELWFPSR
jgi:hypothetical protein